MRLKIILQKCKKCLIIERSRSTKKVLAKHQSGKSDITIIYTLLEFSSQMKLWFQVHVKKMIFNVFVVDPRKMTTENSWLFLLLSWTWLDSTIKMSFKTYKKSGPGIDTIETQKSYDCRRRYVIFAFRKFATFSLVLHWLRWALSFSMNSTILSIGGFILDAGASTVLFFSLHILCCFKFYYYWKCINIDRWFKWIEKKKWK